MQSVILIWVQYKQSFLVVCVEITNSAVSNGVCSKIIWKRIRKIDMTSFDNIIQNTLVIETILQTVHVRAVASIKTGHDETE